MIPRSIPRCRHLARAAAAVSLVLTLAPAAGVAEEDGRAAAGDLLPVEVPDEGFLRDYRLSPDYRKMVRVDGFPIVGSAKVQDAALHEAAYLVGRMLENRPDLLEALVRGRVRFAVMAVDEFTTDVPDHAHLHPKGYWDKRARGLGATPEHPCVSCGEENLLCLEGDPYWRENILVHEFAHAIHDVALRSVDPGFDRRLRGIYEDAMKSGRWDGKYASNNHHEYWAEGVQSFFDTNREDDHDHNHVDTRAELAEYDPALHDLVAEVFRDSPWRYARPNDRAPEGRAHLAAWDPSTAPKFAWPEAVVAAYRRHETGEGLPPLAPRPLGERQGLASPPGGAPVTVRFTNRTGERLRIGWIDFDGAVQSRGWLRAGGWLEQETFVGHAFLVASSDDRPVALFVAGDDPEAHAVIDETPDVGIDAE